MPRLEITRTFAGDWMVCERTPSGFPVPYLVTPWRWAARLYRWLYSRAALATLSAGGVSTAADEAPNAGLLPDSPSL